MATNRATSEERQERRRRIHGYHEEGKSQREIAALVGVSRAWVQKELRAEQRAAFEGSGAVVSMASRAPGRQVNGLFTTTAMQTILPPPDYYSRWSESGLDMKKWDRFTTPQLLRQLLTISPDMSRAVWDWLRMLDPGHEIMAYTIGTDDEDERGKAALAEFIETLEGYYGSFKVQIGRMFMNALIRGAFCVELVLDQRGRMPIDLVVPDPVGLRFRRTRHPKRGETWEMGQWQGGEFVVLDSPLIKYVGIDPEPDSPYGRPMISSAIFPTIFLMGLMQDLRRVVAQQGYPRAHIKILLEQLRAAYKNLNDVKFEEKVGQVVADIQRTYGALEPDDAFTTTDSIEIDHKSGAIDTGVLAGVKSMIDALERMAMRALKTMPLMMGITEGTGEANANRQWEIYAAGIKNLQQLAETVLGRLLTLSMESQGIPCRVAVKFAELRAAEMLRDEQTFKLKLDNAVRARNENFFDQEEASMYATGKAPAGPAPEVPEETTEEEDSDEDDVKAEPGSDRTKDRTERAPLGNVNDAALEDAVALWDDVFEGTKYAGMLDAEVEGNE